MTVEAQLVPLEGWTPGEWDDAIAPFESTGFSHGSGWLDFLQTTGKGTILRFRLDQQGSTLGFFPATLTRKGPFRILGSPLSGSLTEDLGPTGPPGFPVEQFLSALDRFCASHRIHQVELGSPLFEPDVMRRFGYEVRQWRTLEVPLAPSRTRLWQTISSNARNRVRKAERSGLMVRLAGGPDFASRHYALVRQVFRRQRLRPPISEEDVEALCARMAPRDQVFTLEIVHPEREEVLASGLFPHDRGTVYSLSTASSDRGREFCANELLHWSLMELAGSRGVARYRMGDNHRSPVAGKGFKDKFGGSPVPVFRYLRHYSRLARHSRRVFVALRRMGRL